MRKALSGKEDFFEDHRKAAAVGHLSCFDGASGAGRQIRAPAGVCVLPGLFPLGAGRDQRGHEPAAGRGVGDSGGAGNLVAFVYVRLRFYAAQEHPVGIYFISEDIFTLASYYQSDLRDTGLLPEGWQTLPKDELDEPMLSTLLKPAMLEQAEQLNLDGKPGAMG